MLLFEVLRCENFALVFHHFCLHRVLLRHFFSVYELTLYDLRTEKVSTKERDQGNWIVCVCIFQDIDICTH